MTGLPSERRIARARRAQNGAKEKSETAPSAAHGRSRCACGGVCPGCQSSGAGVTISDPDDALERQAESNADRIMRDSKDARDTAPSLSRPTARRSGAASDARLPRGVSSALASAGQPLDARTHAFFSSRFDADFSHVRIHTDTAAQRSAHELGAQAYAIGDDIVFASGRFVPQTTAGRRLLAHELTHVVQDRDAPMKASSAALIHRTPEPEWATKMKDLRLLSAVSLTPDQETDFINGLNEAIHSTPFSDLLGIQLPVQKKPPIDELEPGHVYFDPKIGTKGGKTSAVMGDAPFAMQLKSCGAKEHVGDAILIGPGAVEETFVYTQSMFEHELVHYAISLERRTPGATGHAEWLRAVTASGPGEKDKDEPIAYAAAFEHIFEFSPNERYSAVGTWAKYYSRADADVRFVSLDLVLENLSKARQRDSVKVQGLLQDVNSVQACLLEKNCNIVWLKGANWDALANAMTAIREHLALLEGFPEPK
jgi:hypothetical protein